jgi:osmotically-inducible protein OsmY
MRTAFKFAALSVFALALGTSSLSRAESAGQYIDDAALTAKVKAALLADKQLKATQVNVETNQGAVQLKGTVDSKDQETEAVRAANQVSGVKSVNDLLQVKNRQQEQ